MPRGVRTQERLTPGIRRLNGPDNSPVLSYVRNRWCNRLMDAFGYTESWGRVGRRRLLLAELGIEHVSKGVTEQVEPEHTQADGHAGPDRHPRRTFGIFFGASLQH